MFLGIDTSAYTTSVALVRENSILENQRILLKTPAGQKGLRQSDAFYQHWTQLPQLLQPLLQQYGNEIECVCVASKPRPVEGSYMPVFNAGVQAAQLIAASLNVPLFYTSHQEGHVLAAAYGNTIDLNQRILFAHLSGGTLELILIEQGQFSIVGQTKDISYGQLIDRFGVAFDFAFPAGRYVDELALQYSQAVKNNPISKVFVDGTTLCLSGTEDSVYRAKKAFEKDYLSACLLTRIGESLCKVLDTAADQYHVEQILLGGGVACSEYLRNYCKKKPYQFGQKSLCNDNACGVALTRGKNPWL